MKKAFKIIAIALAVLIVLSFAKNIIARTLVSAGVKAVTGLRISMKSMNVGIIRTLVDIKGLRLFSPAGFPDREMLNMPEAYVDYDLGAFLKGKTHLEEVRLNLKEFVIVKNEKGELNLDSLKVGKKARKEKAPREFRIDALHLKIGKVIYKDYSAGTPPRVTEFVLNLDERYENITNPYAVSNLIVFRALVNTTVARLTDFELGPLKEQIGGSLGKVKAIAEQTTGKATEKAVEAI
ncbi:MAG: hypothetical protein L0922_06815, partial [Candidatus Mariimomonas ferrooxydans]